MGFLRKLFGLPDENDFDTMYQVAYDNMPEESNDNSPVYLAAGEGNFMFTVQDVFVIKGRGTVVTGVIDSGTVSTGDTVNLNGAKKQASYKIGGIESFRKLLDSASMGDNVGLFLLGASKEDICRGDKLYM